jgi:hypothetical protein
MAVRLPLPSARCPSGIATFGPLADPAFGAYTDSVLLAKGLASRLRRR